LLRRRFTYSKRPQRDSFCFAAESHLVLEEISGVDAAGLFSQLSKVAYLAVLALDEHLAGVQIGEESALDPDLPGLRGVNRKPKFFDALL
jgi:hypothetical protein